MSFPSALQNYKNGMSDEAALLSAFETDTPEGYTALLAFGDAVREKPTDVVAFIRDRLARFGTKVQDAVLRSEERGEGLLVDFDPNSKLGTQVARLMTDVARAIMEKKLELHLGFANCCKSGGSPKKEDVIFTPLEQIQWQESIDC